MPVRPLAGNAGLAQGTAFLPRHPLIARAPSFGLILAGIDKPGLREKQFFLRGNCGFRQSVLTG